MSFIDWQTTLGYAEDSASSSRKPILFDYFSPECIGCKQMAEVTYQAKEVVDFVTEYMIPLRIDVEKKDLYDAYNAIWTPTLLILDYQGHEVQRTVGFLGPNSFLALMLLGIAKVQFATGEFDAANVQFKRIIERYPESSVVPEAIYFRGVNLCKQKDDPKQLKMAYEELRHNYPDNSWTKRAVPYRVF